MSASPNSITLEQAIAWHLRLKDADENAWIEFSEWLDADPSHNDAYEAVVDGDAHMSGVLEAATFPSDDDQIHLPVLEDGEIATASSDDSQVTRVNRWRWSALAASIAVIGLISVQMLPSRDARYSVETSAGETRTVSLADGSQIMLNGNTQILLDRNDARMAEIAKGEARFDIKHNASDPFTVIAGDQRLVDIGTVFNVVRTDQQFRVGVAEGSVRFEGIAHSVKLHAGDSLAADNRGKVEISQKPVTSIGSWTDGILVYDLAPLEEVASDLSRTIGVSFNLPTGMRSESFSGVIQTDGGKDKVRGRLEELIGRKIVTDGARWSVDVQ